MSVHESYPGPPGGPIVFSYEQIRCLEEANIFLPEPQKNTSTNPSGKRKVSAAFSAQSLSNSSSASASSSSASISTHGFQPHVIQTFDIPIAEESIEVLEYIGFIPDVARLIYGRYCDRPNPTQNPDDLMAYVSGHLASLKSRNYDSVAPKEALRYAGLNPQIQDAITDLRFSPIFGTETLEHWAKDTVETNYAALLSQQKLLQRNANQRMARNKNDKRARHEPHRNEQQQQQSPVTATINITPKDFQFPENNVTVRSDVQVLDNHVSLFKGKSFYELSQPGDIIEPDGSVDLSPLRTHPGGDFNWNFNAHYWTPDKQTAEEYRKFAERRCPTAESCVIHIQIPRAFVDSLRREDLWFSRDWKEYVWTSRTEKKPDKKFDYLWKPGQADVVQGPICSAISTKIARIRQEDVQSTINEDHVMRLRNGKKASQWVFVQTDSVSRLAEELKR
ncbi:unnamed protein product [Penicillium salamii]|uniref:Uncharacterized protein n=1 Tax=Penicillium salamii TaxID=1612424 RepID=A0A9W4JTR1_9EURO|nr:unnamed protein product [Penicillium salamii]